MRRSLAALVVAAACSSPAKQPGPVELLVVDVPPPPVDHTAAARQPDPAPPSFRLPGDVAPLAERVELTIAPTLTDVPGHAGIDATVRRPTRVVWLNATGLTVTHATLGGAAARVIPGGDDFVGLTIDGALPPGPLAIALDFTAHIDHDKSRGIYSEREGSGGSDAYVYTFFEPTDARRAFPCFDEPNYKIPWTLTLHVQRDHIALGNAPITSETAEPGGMKRVVLAQSRPLPSYLVAFVVGPFELVDAGTAGRAATPIRFVIPKGRAGELAYAKAITPKLVAALEDYFDMPYPYGKLDVAVVPRYWGTMEHPGLLAMGQPLTLIQPAEATRSRREAYANIAAHELSHYWFGDYVTLAWWDDAWLNEALGEWLDGVITNAVEPSWRFELTRAHRVRAGLRADETLAAQKIRVPVMSPQDIDSAFSGDITYLKGSSVLRMFEAYVGPEKWRAFMREWVRAHAWGTATSDDLFAAMAHALGAQIAASVRSFVEQPGAPLITMTLDCHQGAALLLHQSRALPAGIADVAPHTWTVPVCVRTAAGRACTMLEQPDGRIALPGACPAWLVPNADATGYYRSAYAGTVDLLTPSSPAARAAQPTAAEKLLLIGDVRAAVERDEVTVAAELALAAAVATDADPRIASEASALAATHFDELDDALYARGIHYLRSVLLPLAQRLGWTRRAADSDDTQELRRSVMGIARHDAALSKQATALALRWFDDRTAIADDLVTNVLTTAAVHGDAALFERMVARAKTPRDRTEAQRMFETLGSFSDPALVDRALALTLSPDIDLRDSVTVIYVALAARATRARAVAFVETHLDALLARQREDEASWLLGAIAETNCDADTHARMAALVAPRAAKLSGAQAAVDQGLAKSAACIASFQRQLPALRAFLAKH